MEEHCLFPPQFQRKDFQSRFCSGHRTMVDGRNKGWMKNCKCQSSGLRKDSFISSSASVSALSRGKLPHENARFYLVIFSICLFYLLVKG